MNTLRWLMVNATAAVIGCLLGTAVVAHWESRFWRRRTRRIT